MEPGTQVLKLYQELQGIETAISKQMGSLVWDYGPALTGSPPLSMDLINLTPQTTTLLNDYIYKVQEILGAESLPQMPIVKDKPLINFSEAMHTLYYLKLKQAEMIYGEYELLRIQTWLESKLLDTRVGLVSEPENTFAIDLPGTIILTPDRSVDIEATLAKENAEHNIKSYLSCFSYARRIRDQFLLGFTEYTTKAMVPRFFFTELEDLSEALLTEFMTAVTKQIYGYLSKGYTPRQAQSNSFSYFVDIFKNQHDTFLPDLTDLATELRRISDQALKEIKSLEEQTRNVLTEELLAYLIFFFKTQKLLPRNYYKFEFRESNPKHESELEFDYVLDSFLLEDDGSEITYPLETYAFALTPESKIDIFNYVTDGFVNPNFALQDYLVYT